MQDLAQIQNPTNTVQANTSPQPVISPQQTAPPVGLPAISINKEHAPISAVKSEAVKPVESQPEITPSAPPEIMIPQELKNTIEKSPGALEPKIEKETRLAGVKLAKESTPVITTPTGIIRLPMTYSQALQKEKSSAFWDSIHWFAAQIMYQWRKHDSDIVKETKTK